MEHSLEFAIVDVVNIPFYGDIEQDVSFQHQQTSLEDHGFLLL